MASRVLSISESHQGVPRDVWHRSVFISSGEKRIFATSTMCRRAGPQIIFSAIHNSGTHRISLDIAYRVRCVTLVHDANVGPALEHVTNKTVLGVEIHRVRCVRPMQSLGYPVFGIWYGNEVTMIGHQGVGPDRHAVLRAPLSQEAKIDQIIRVDAKNGRFANATLANVMSSTRHAASKLSGHMT